MKLPFKPLYWRVRKALEPKTWLSETFHVFCGVVWFQLVSWGRVGPPFLPCFSLSLRWYETSAAFDGTICQLNFVLKFSSVVLSGCPPPLNEVDLVAARGAPGPELVLPERAADLDAVVLDLVDAVAAVATPWIGPAG